MNLRSLLNQATLLLVLTISATHLLCLKAQADPLKEFQPADTMSGLSDSSEIVITVKQLCSGSCTDMLRTPKFHLVFEVFRMGSRHLVPSDKTEILSVSLGSIPTGTKPVQLNQTIRLNLHEINSALSKLPNPIIYDSLKLDRENRVMKISLYQTGFIMDGFIKELNCIFPIKGSSADQLPNSYLLSPQKTIKASFKGINDAEMTLSIRVEDKGEGAEQRKPD